MIDHKTSRGSAWEGRRLAHKHSACTQPRVYEWILANNRTDAAKTVSPNAALAASRNDYVPSSRSMWKLGEIQAERRRWTRVRLHPAAKVVRKRKRSSRVQDLDSPVGCKFGWRKAIPTPAPISTPSLIRAGRSARSTAPSRWSNTEFTRCFVLFCASGCHTG